MSFMMNCILSWNFNFKLQANKNMNLNMNLNLKVNLNFNLNLKLNLNWGSAQYSASEKLLQLKYLNLERVDFHF